MSTIFAPITSINQNGVCVIRISGDNTKKCLESLGIDIANIKDRVAKLCNITINKELIDKSLITFFNSPHSYTGEDVAEISIHASKYIYNEIALHISKISNVRLAQAGEFSKRAFINNKIDLLTAESVIDLIASETKIQHRQALRQYNGKISNIYNSIRNNILKSLSLIEALIDFPDDDIPNEIIDEVNNIVKDLIVKISSMIDDKMIGQKIKSGFEVVIIGKPNVGKSTLINYLTGNEIAITSNISGTTRDIISSYIDIDGLPIIISDTAGITETDNIIEIQGIKKAIDKANKCDLKIIVINPEQEINSKIINLINKNSLIIINKIDQSNSNNINKCKDILKKYCNNIIAISLKENLNICEIKPLIAKILNKEYSNINESIITSQRHRLGLNNSLIHLRNFSLDKTIEIAAEDLRLAAQELSIVTGDINIDNILDEIFSGFCIGK